MGKIIFASEDLKQKFRDIFLFCNEHEIEMDVDCIDFDAYELSKSDSFDLEDYFNENDFVEDVHITEDTDIKIIPPRSDTYEELPLDYFYSMMKESLSGKIEDDMRFTSPRLALFYIESDYTLLEYIENLSINQQWGDTEVDVDLVRGLTSFGIRLTIDGNFDKYCPPLLDDDTFIEIRSEDDLDIQDFEDIVEAYIFELQSSFSLKVRKSARPTGLGYLEKIQEDPGTDVRLRPLMNGKGISTLLKIYNSCNDVEDNEFRILNYTKVIEYVSQTVIRKEMLDSILKKLYSSKVLQPDATYILELEQLYDEHRNNKKDHQSIKLTVETCCDLSDLVDIAPTFLKKFSELKKKGENKDLRALCLDELSSSISDTRNMIAHAKTNYKIKGKECPRDEMEEYANCLKVVATQVIRWFARQHEDSRII